MKSKVNVVCIKWGTKYPSTYVNRLYSMVKRNLSVDFDFTCFTDDATDLDEFVRSLPLPDLWEGWWNKISLFRDDLFPVGEIILYFDLDIVITNNIDFLLEGNDKFVVCRRFSDGNRFGCNSSVMKISSGSLSFVYQLLKNNPKIIEKYRSDQDLISDVVEDLNFFPKSKIASFKLCLSSHVWGDLHRLKIGNFLPEIRPPHFLTTSISKQTSIVVFHGKPDPADVMDTSYGSYRRDPFISKHWK